MLHVIHLIYYTSYDKPDVLYIYLIKPYSQFGLTMFLDSLTSTNHSLTGYRPLYCWINWINFCSFLFCPSYICIYISNIKIPNFVQILCSTSLNFSKLRTVGHSPLFELRKTPNQNSYITSLKILNICAKPYHWRVQNIPINGYFTPC